VTIGRALLLVNPGARMGDSDLGLALKPIEAAGIEIVRPEHRLEVWEFADCIRAEGRASDAVIVGGGDGTLSTCAKAMAEIGRPMGILPLGTANDLARTLKIPTALPEAGAIIAKQYSEPVDIGMVNGHPFFNVVTIGLAADMATRLDRMTKKRWGRFGYAIGAMRVALGARRFTASITTARGTETVKTYQIAIGNGRYYGGGVVVHADATIHDGMLDLYSLELQTLWKLALMFPAFRRGEHGGWDDVRVDHAHSFEIRTRKPQPVNADGEVVTQTPVKLEVLKRAVKVFVPQPGA
jgi:diacylglycerol kinase (ATP)